MIKLKPQHLLVPSENVEVQFYPSFKFSIGKWGFLQKYIQLPFQNTKREKNSRKLTCINKLKSDEWLLISVCELHDAENQFCYERSRRHQKCLKFTRRLKINVKLSIYKKSTYL